MIKARLKKIRDQFVEYNLDGYGVPKNEEFIYEYSNNDTIDGDAILYAEKTQKNDIDATIPITRTYGHEAEGLVNHSLTINCIVGSVKVLNFPSPVIKNIIKPANVAKI